MKKTISILSALFSLNLVSAYSYGYGDFSFSELLNQIDSSTMILGAVFIISLVLINFALSRVFKNKHDEPDTKVSGILALAISLLITWGVNKSGLDFEGFFYGFGFSSEILYTLFPLIILGAIVFMGIKWGFGKAIFLIGLTFIVLSFFVYEKGAIIFFGILLAITGAIIWNKWPKKSQPRRGSPGWYS